MSNVESWWGRDERSGNPSERCSWPCQLGSSDRPLLEAHLVGAGNESETPPPGMKEAVRRVEISSRPLPHWSMTQAVGLILSSFDSSFAH